MERGELQRRAVSGATWTLAHVAVSLPLAFGVNIVLARTLGVADFGRLAYLTMVMEIVGVIVGVGVGAALIQFGAKAHSAGSYAEVRRLLRGTQGFRVIVGAPVLTVVVCLLADVPLEFLLLAVLFGIWVPAAFGGASAALTIQNDTARAARLAMTVNLATQCAIVTAVLIVPSADVVWSTRMVMAGLGVIAAILLVQGRYRRAVLTPRWPSNMPGGFWRFAVPMGVSGLVGTIALGRSEVVFLEHLSTAEQVGLYAVAFGLAGHLFAPAQALLNPLTPAISALREVEPGAVQEAFRRTSRVSGVVAGGMVAVGGPALGLLIPVLYGVEYAPAARLVLALVVVSGFLIVLLPMETFVTARLRAGSLLSVNVASLVASVGVAILLIPWIGAWGAVVGKGAVVLTRIAWLGWKEQDSFMVGGAEFLAGFRVMVGASVVAVLGYAVGEGWVKPASSAIVASATAALVGLLLYPALLRVLRCGLRVQDVGAIVRALPAGSRPLISRLLLATVGTLDRPAGREGR